VAVATALTGLVAWREFGPGVAWPTMWLLTPMVLQPGIEQFTANTPGHQLSGSMNSVGVWNFSGATGGFCSCCCQW
jgi:hypothetical protein